MSEYLYKFLVDGMKSKYDGSEWVVGKWRKVATPNEECVGLNASPLVQQALGYVHGTILAKVECTGKIIKGNDKWTCERMRVVEVAPWTKRESVSLAVFAAELVLPKWSAKHPDDDRSAKAIAVAKEWLETGKKPAAAAAAAKRKIHDYALSLVKFGKEATCPR